MEYGFVRPGDLAGRSLTIPRGQYIAGSPIGIIHLEVWYPLLPGNVVNASTYPFPVRYRLIEGATQERILAGDPTLLDAIVAAGRALEQEGVRAIAGACGYLGRFQPQAAAALDVPVFLSSLVQVPMIALGLKPGQRIGVLCAHGPSLTPAILSACGIDPGIPLTIRGLEDGPEFAKITYSRGEFDVNRLEAEVVAAAAGIVEEYPDTGAILLECSDMPPFAWAVQRAVRRPVFDFITLIRWVHSAVVQRPYEGTC